MVLPRGQRGPDALRTRTPSTLSADRLAAGPAPPSLTRVTPNPPIPQATRPPGKTGPQSPNALGDWGIGGAVQRPPDPQGPGGPRARFPWWTGSPGGLGVWGSLRTSMETATDAAGLGGRARTSMESPWSTPSREPRRSRPVAGRDRRFGKGVKPTSPRLGKGVGSAEPRRARTWVQPGPRSGVMPDTPWVPGSSKVRFPWWTQVAGSLGPGARCAPHPGPRWVVEGV